MDYLHNLVSSCAEYPKNQTHLGSSQFILDAYFKELSANARNIFQDQTRANTWIKESSNETGSFQIAHLKNLSEVRKQLGLEHPVPKSDPFCRFIIVPASPARKRLKITKEMLTTIFSYHQVLPSFLELVFPFGWQTDPKDDYFGGFRHQAHVREQEKEIRIPELGRSGRTFRMCYNLKSAGKDLKETKWPWFIGQSAIHHSFDIETGVSCWVVVTTGDQDLQHRIDAVTGGQAQPQLTLQDLDCRFASNLMVHLIFCEWSAYSWRKYIDFLQEELEGLTKRAVSEILDQPSLQTRTGNQRIEQATGRPITDIEPVDGELSRPNDLRTGGLYGAKFSFRDIQKAQAIEEKFQQADLLLRIDSEVLTELLESCHALKDSLESPVEARERNKEDFIRFQQRIRSIQKDIEIQQMRISTVLKKSADRKILVYAILDGQKYQASQVSAEKMERMTEEVQELTKKMHTIAEDTREETVSMRIMALIALLFLPVTFTSTLMGTKIFQAANSAERSRAIGHFFLLSTPLFGGTVMIWFSANSWYQRGKRKEKKD